MVNYFKSQSYITFCVPLFIDSKEREKNRDTFISYWKNHVNILLWTCSKDFHRVHIHNNLARLVKTPFMALVDIDCIVPYSQILKACNRMSKGVDFILPYDQPIKNIDSHLNVKETWSGYVIDEKLLKKYFDETITWNIPEIINTPIHKGLIFCANLKSFFKFGLENEHFFGWGFEDEERLERAKKLGFSFERIPGDCYHLEHPKSPTCRQNDLWKNNFFEFFKIRTMNSQELQKYIKTWHWNK